ncbi:MAG: acyl-CoA dehydrogenase N-terminal domain-containing protein, partial [Gammaproteobacteria bacterium]|nr:acyl-CoA dehydrogenase N-terminal domain-containing protein [Gammaproteobacteria bacterium]
MSQTINRRDLDFLIYEMLDVESLCVRGYFSGQGRDIFDPMLDLAE